MITIISRTKFFRKLRQKLGHTFKDNKHFKTEEEFNQSFYNFVACKVYNNPNESESIINDSQLNSVEKIIFKYHSLELKEFDSVINIANKTHLKYF